MTLNVNGLNDDKKRKKLFTHFKMAQQDIICIQETHSTITTSQQWKQEWESNKTFTSYWNSGTYKSCGVAILIKDSATYKVIDTTIDDKGRIINVKMKIYGINVQITSAYAPNRPHLRTFFFDKLRQQLSTKYLTIIGGDYNMVEDVNIDRRGGTLSASHQRGLTELDKLKDDHQLIDIWRTQNKYKREYTWKSKDGKIRSRLDRFYLSKTFINQYVTADNYPCLWSDHNFVTVHLSFRNKQDKRGRGFWKLNTQILTEREYKEEITQFITYWKTKQTDYNDVIKWWEIGKLHIQMTTRNYCTTRKKEQTDKLRTLKTYIEAENEAQQPNEHDIERWYEEIRDIHDKQNQGIMIRSRAKDIINGEKPTNYFYNMEKRNKEKSVIHKIKLGPHTYTTDRQTTQTGIKDYYQALYTKQDTSTQEQQKFLNEIDQTLPQHIADKIDAPITKDELKRTMQNMEHNKAPGIDGLPIEFLETFWEEIKEEMEEISRLIFENQVQPAYQQRLGIINLIHKKGEKEDLTNWRPISLLCADYKLITKTIATRLREGLNHIIHPDQTCSVPGRTIFENLYTIRDVINLAETKRQKTYIISFDFEKAFDKVDHNFLIKTLETFKFGERFVNFIQTIYTNTKAQVNNNGYLTDTIDIQRGIRQGCPLSLPLYCIVAEVLANTIRKNENITGFTIPGKTQRIKNLLYADDNISITTNPKSIDIVVQTFDRFREASGCNLNQDKIRGIILGDHTVQPPDTRAKIKWQKEEGIEIMGIRFFTDLYFTQTYNWRLLTKQITERLEKLKYRSLSLQGKKTLLNTTILSKLWYLATVFSIPPAELKIINQEIFKFIWDYKQPEPIKRNTLYQPISNGGIGLLNILIQQQAIRIKQLYEIVNENSKKTWVHYGRYWIARVITKYNENWKFLQNNSSPKYNGTDPPLYYKEFVNYLKDFNEKAKQLKFQSTKEIYNLIFHKEFQDIAIKAERYWNTALSQDLPWANLWGNNYKSFVVGRHQDILFKFMHNC